jgi:GNAT superfamily N-acetyltransferase
MRVRPALEADLDAITGVADLVGQGAEGGGGDRRYARHLLTAGRLAVAEVSGHVVGYGASRRVGDADMLCDLFIHPEHRGVGVGRALLASVWSDAPHRQTFSSLHPAALPLYVGAGLTPRWPLFYLAGDTDRLRPVAGTQVSRVDVGAAASAEEALTGHNRLDDYRYWASRPSGQCVVVTAEGAVVGVGVTGGGGDGFGVSHLYTPTGDEDAVVAVLAQLGRRAMVTVPGPHPALPRLLESGWRIEYSDIYVSTDASLVDPERWCPHPGLL